MPTLNKTLSDFKYALISSDKALSTQIDLDKVIIFNSLPQINQLDHLQVVAVDYTFLINFADQFKDYLKKTDKKLIVIFENKDTVINIDQLSLIHFHKLLLRENFQMSEFYQQEDNLIFDQQNTTYLTMSNELNTEYEALRNELISKLNETRVDLINSRQKILDANNRSESMRKILFSISMETSIEEIELRLNELLPATTKATWIKIVPQDQLEQFKNEIDTQINTSYNFYKINDIYLFFIKGDSKSFKKDDLNLFAKIKDILEININRENNFSRLVLTEKIVRTAFENFNHPLAIIDQNYDTLQANAAFKRNQTSSQKCYEVFFNRVTPCEGCHLDRKFSINYLNTIYEVDSRPIKNEYAKSKAWINIYRNQTEKKYFEQRLKQTTQLKELGLISSSIAHELNNPIGGILSYLQLIMMDLPKNPSHEDLVLQRDIQSMIDTTLKIKKIIEDLLIFSRVPQNKERKLYSVADLISENLSLQELQFKSENIKVVNHTTKEPTVWLLSKSDFRDSLHFIFNFFIERIRIFRKNNAQKTGLVEIKFSSENTSQTHAEILTIEFLCNCGQLDLVEKAKDISLLALSKLLTDQKIIFEMNSFQENWITLKLIIPKS